MLRRCLFALVAFCPLLARADDSAEPLEEMIVFGRQTNLIGDVTAASEGRVAQDDIRLRPLGRVGELVETIPGVIATQHSGPGKANQFFLRGFNLDHGTDSNVLVDGVPLNLRTHGHGQGYLDLNGLIPDLVETIDFRKGPYRADTGDFAAAGSAFFSTYDRLDRSRLSFTAGQNGFYRGLAATSTRLGDNDLLVAFEAKTFDDPFELDADLTHLSGRAKLSRPMDGGVLRLAVFGYHADWASTDQVPQRAIDSGLIEPLGFIDPDLGGNTTRFGASLSWEGAGPAPLTASAYAYYYNFNLFSNFTYFLDDPVNGDEFEQADERVVLGGAVRKDWAASMAGRRG